MWTQLIMAPSIGITPDEVLVEILGMLPKQDLKIARLTCTLWSTAGAKWMFRRVYFAPRNATMKTFSSIAANPAFARNVKELIYDGRLFLPRLSTWKIYRNAFITRVYEEDTIYQKAIEISSYWEVDTHCADQVYQNSIWNMENVGFVDRSNNCIAHESPTYFENVSTSLGRYSCFLDHQENTLEAKKDFEALCIGFKTLTNINTVLVLDNFKHSPTYDLGSIKECEWPDDHGWYSFQSTREFGLTVPPSKWPCQPRRRGVARDRNEKEKWDTRGVQNLFRALSIHCPNLKALHMASQSSKFPMTIFHFSDIDTIGICALAGRLTILELHPHVTSSDTTQEHDRQLRCLNLFLNEAKGLRSLSSSEIRELSSSESSRLTSSGLRRVSLSSSHPDNSGAPNETDADDWISGTDCGLFVGKAWPHLTTLTLGPIWMRRADLGGLLRAHKDTLRKITLHEVFILDDCGWKHIAREVGQLPSLHSIQITWQDFFKRPTLEQVTAFALDMMPWAPEDSLEVQEGYLQNTLTLVSPVSMS